MFALWEEEMKTFIVILVLLWFSDCLEDLKSRVKVLETTAMGASK